LVEFKRYLVKRVFLAVLVVFGAMTITFFIFKAMPGDPVTILLGKEGKLYPELVEAVTKTWHLRDPPHLQYFWYMSNLLRGNMGTSMYTRSPVAEELARRMPVTIELVLASFFVSLGIAIPAGVIAAVKRGKWIDGAARVFSIVGVSGPNFWWAILFLYVFYLILGWLSTGRLDLWTSPPPIVTRMYTIDSLLAGRFDTFLEALKHLILPSITLGITRCGMMMRLTRSSMLEIINSDYIAAARMKGLPERIVVYRHALRNALIPTVTWAGMSFGAMLGGSVFIETIFNWRGIGQFAVGCIFSADYPGVMGVVLYMAIIYAVCNLVVDVLYGYLDPRVRVGG